MKFKETKEIMIEIIKVGEDPAKIAEDIWRKVITPMLQKCDDETIKLEAQIEDLQEDIEDLQEENDDLS